jgi:hypothetical protein
MRVEIRGRRVVSHSCGKDILVDHERLSTQETLSDPGRETSAPPSSNVTEDPSLDEEIRSESHFEGIAGKSSALCQVLQISYTEVAQRVEANSNEGQAR